MSEVLYSEPGANWRTLVLAPAFAAVGLISDALIGGGMRWFVWVIAAILLGAIGSWMVLAARQHASLAVSKDVLVQGQEELPTWDIVKVFPPVPRDRAHDDPAEHWESARALGAISRVPRGRRGVGLQLRRGNPARAWAKDDHALRAALQTILDDRRKAAGVR